MTLKKVIAKSNWERVRQVFLLNYPSQKKTITGYESVYKKLRSKSPASSKMKLYCEQQEPTIKGDEQFHELYGIDGTKREDGELEKFSLSLSPWSLWLGSSLSKEILSNYTIEEIISHCLYEMTFHGFSEAEIKKFNKELVAQNEDYKDPVRFIIVSKLLPGSKWQLFFNLSDDTWCSDIDSATIFKRENYASAMLKALSRKKDKSTILAKITIKDKKRRILQYL